MGAALDFVAPGFGRGGLIRRPDRLEETFRAKLYRVGNFCGRDGGILEDDAGFGSPRKEESDGPAGGMGMGSENAKGIGVCAGEERVDAGVKFRVGAFFWRERARGGLFGVFQGQDRILLHAEEPRQGRRLLRMMLLLVASRKNFLTKKGLVV